LAGIDIQSYTQQLEKTWFLKRLFEQ
jgi:hypothetical protein